MLNKTITEFMEESASKAPVPGGGGVSALCGALAASLSEMVTNLTTGKKKYAEYEKEIRGIMKRAETLRNTLSECIKEDAEAFAKLIRDVVLPNKEDFEKKGAKGREYFLQHFTKEHCINNLCEIINR